MPDFDVVELEFPTGQFSSFDQMCMYQALIKSNKADIYLEIGVDRGKSLAFARKYFRGDVFGIDLVDEGGSRVQGTNLIIGDSNEVFWNLPVRVLFIDGEHSYEQVKRDYQKFSKFVIPGGWVFFHDADDTSPGVVQFTKEIGGVTYSDNPRCSMAWKQL